jgi:hypothetical protein
LVKSSHAVDSRHSAVDIRLADVVVELSCDTEDVRGWLGKEGAFVFGTVLSNRHDLNNMEGGRSLPESVESPLTRDCGAAFLLHRVTLMGLVELDLEPPACGATTVTLTWWVRFRVIVFGLATGSCSEVLGHQNDPLAAFANELARLPILLPRRLRRMKVYGRCCHIFS